MTTRKAMVDFLLQRQMPLATTAMKSGALAGPLGQSQRQLVRDWRTRLEALDEEALAVLYAQAQQSQAKATSVNLPETLTRVRAVPAPPAPSAQVPVADWAKWKHMRDVELWEAVSLALNIEPSELPAYLGAFEAFGDSDVFRICPPEFQRRLAVANSNAGISLPIKPVHDLKARCLVDLPTFGTWAAGVWTDLPDQMPRASPEAARAPVATELAATVPAEEGRDERCARMARWFEEEVGKRGEWGALARVAKRDGRKRQTVKADIEYHNRKRSQQPAPSSPWRGL